LLSSALAAAAPRREALRAACRQADAARERARARPGVASAVTSLRVAEDILADARAKQPVQALPGADLPDLNAQLATSDTALAFARAQFNAAVAAYNESVRQFPTVLVARLFGFRSAAAF
jgi:LemA protein